MSIIELRQEYMRAGLCEADADANAVTQFERWFAEALAAGVALPNAMTLATVNEANAPDARIVLLKGVEDGQFVFYSNYLSRKGRQLARHPSACLVFFWVQLERQVRIDGSIEKLQADDSERYFVSRPLGSRIAAWASPQSEPVADRAVLERAYGEMQQRYGEAPPCPPHWGGYRLLPRTIEFWQGRANRLHDRLLYRRSDGGWKISRLAP